MKTVKAGKHKKAKIVPMNATPAVGAGKTGKSPEITSKTISTDTQKPKITYDMIAQKAWSIWMSRGCKPGQDEINWFQAELELRNVQNKKSDICDTDKE